MQLYVALLTMPTSTHHSQHIMTVAPERGHAWEQQRNNPDVISMGTATRLGANLLRKRQKWRCIPQLKALCLPLHPHEHALQPSRCIAQLCCMCKQAHVDVLDTAARRETHVRLTESESRARVSMPSCARRRHRELGV
jgi:hypothetical protein